MDIKAMELKIEGLLQSMKYLRTAIQRAPDEADRIRLGELLDAYEDQLLLTDGLLQTRSRWAQESMAEPDATGTNRQRDSSAGVANAAATATPVGTAAARVGGDERAPGWDHETICRWTDEKTGE